MRAHSIASFVPSTPPPSSEAPLTKLLAYPLGPSALLQHLGQRRTNRLNALPRDAGYETRALARCSYVPRRDVATLENVALLHHGSHLDAPMDESG